MKIRVQKENFDTEAEIAKLLGTGSGAGAVVSFRGLVRDDNPENPLKALVLEHYPEMTTTAIEAIARQAEQKWPIIDGLVIHRYGRLLPGENIVLVAVTSSHRGEAFEAANFLIDWLKTKAPFWKKEERENGDLWVGASAADEEAAKRW